MPRFTYHPAALRAEETVQSDVGGFRRGAGPQRSWRELTAVGYSRSATRGIVMVSFDLRFGSERECLSMTGVPAEAAAFNRMLAQICQEILTSRPEMQADLGYSGAARRGMFVTGVLILLTGVFFLFLGLSFALAGGGEAVVFLVLAVGLGLWGMVQSQANRPWVKPRQIALASLAAALVVEVDREMPDS